MIKKGYLEEISDYLLLKYGLKVERSQTIVTGSDETQGWMDGKLYIPDYFRVPMGNQFIGLHIFGHLVQFAIDANRSSPLDTTDLDNRLNSELNAFSYGVKIASIVSNSDQEYLDQYIQFSYADFIYYKHFLVTGEKEISLFYKTLDCKREENILFDFPANEIPTGFHSDIPVYMKKNIKTIWTTKK